MFKLLSANFSRLKKDKVFWLCMLCMFGYGLLIFANGYSAMKARGITADAILYGYNMMVGLAATAFCGLHIGTDYSDGTIRNKIIVGHTRRSVYMAQFIVCTAAGMALIAAYVIPVTILGVALLGVFTMSAYTLLEYLICSILALMALTAILTLCCMLNQNKAASSVCVVLGVFVMLMAAIYLNTSLNSPPTYDSYEAVGDSESEGTFQAVEDIPNPSYISGKKRVVYENLRDFLPTGQQIQFASFEAEHIPRMAAYSMSLIVIFSGVGIFAFERKDLK